MATSASSSSTNAIQALGVGSGIDIKALAQNLTDAEIGPRRDAVQQRIDNIEAKISAYATIKFAVNELQKSFAALKDTNDYDSVTVRSSDSTAVEVRASSGASAASHEISISQLARGQRNISTSFSSPAATLSGSTAIPSSFRLTVNGSPSTTISVSTMTAEGMVKAINDATVTTGISATLIDASGSGIDYRVVLQGETGVAKSFSITDSDGSTTITGALFSNSLNADQIAADASFSIDGLSIIRSKNIVDDVVPGLSFNLLQVSASPISVGVSRDIAPIKEKIKTIVTTYNDLQAILDEAANRESEVEGLGGTLVGDSTERLLRSKIRDLLLNSYSISGTGYTRLGDLGISVDRDGKLEINSEATLDNALVSEFDDVVSLLAGSSNGNDGIGDSISQELSNLTSSLGLIQTQSRSATERLDDYKDQLAKLETRMEKLLENYTRQFAAMDALVGQTNSLRTSVENSFKGMSYSNQ